MGQEQSSTMNNSQGPHKSCRPCGDWGQKDHGTVKVDAAALHALGKENAAHPNILNSAGGKGSMSLADQEAGEKARQCKEWEAKQEDLRRQEEQRREMERRIKDEQERQQAELRRREAERRRLQLEQETREAEEIERQRRTRDQQLALQAKQQEQERQLEEQRKEEARAKKLQEMADQKKVRDWLQANGFKSPNDLVRKKLSKVAPLQLVIQQNDVEMLKLLLQAGAALPGSKSFSEHSSWPRVQVNGKNESALTVAQKLDKKGSHAGVVQTLMTYSK